jgi:N-acetylated-alpha-linked acidic dipeptidase
MKLSRFAAVSVWLITALCYAQDAATSSAIFGFRNPASESEVERRFLAVPSPQLAEQHLRTLTAAPHVAGSPEDRQTAEYVAQKYREAGFDTQIPLRSAWT